MRKIFTIIITIVLLITTICLSVGAVSHNNGEAGTGEYLPWLNYTVTAETDTTNIVLFDAPVLSSTYREYIQSLSEYEANNALYSLPYIDIESLGLTKKTALDLYTGTIAYRVPDLAGDNVTPIETVGNTVSFDPFSINYDYAFDSLSIKISDIIGSFNWYGTDIINTTIGFRMGFEFYYPWYSITSEEGTQWFSLSHEYQFEYVETVDTYFWGTDDINVSNVAVYDVSDNEQISYADFVREIENLDAYIEDGDVWIDVSYMEIDFTYSGGGTAQFVHQKALYGMRDVYNNSNDGVGDIISSTIGVRQNCGTSRIYSYEWALRRQRQYSRELWVSTEGGTIIDGVGARLASLVRLFANTVGAVLDVDLFGVGITLGHITLIALLAAIVMIYLRFFAGG